MSQCAAKSLIRRELRRAVARLSAAQRVTFSSQLCQSLRELAVWRSAGSILAFWPLAGEPDLMPLLQEALEEGRKVAFPRYDPSADAYEPGEVRGLDELVEVDPGVLRHPHRGPAADGQVRR